MNPLPVEYLLRVALIPIWLATLCMQPFLRETHPWKHKRLTLAWWAAGATRVAIYISLAFWAQLLIGASLLYRILK